MIASVGWYQFLCLVAIGLSYWLLFLLSRLFYDLRPARGVALGIVLWPFVLILLAVGEEALVVWIRQNPENPPDAHWVAWLLISAVITVLAVCKLYRTKAGPLLEKAAAGLVLVFLAYAIPSFCWFKASNSTYFPPGSDVNHAADLMLMFFFGTLGLFVVSSRRARVTVVCSIIPWALPFIMAVAYPVAEAIFNAIGRVVHAILIR